MSHLLIQYPKCSTCKKAVKWLDDHQINYTSRNITMENPTKQELSDWIKLSGLPIKRFFNTSGILYREMGLKDKLNEMTDDEKLNLLSSDGMLVKRPLIVSEQFILVGFKEQEWANQFQQA